MRIFHAVGSKARTGVDLTRPQAATYVGRTDELAELTRLFESTGGETPVRLVTVIGEAGMGKSRMVAELRAHVDRLAGPVTWRQGRCLPYGEGITFWALGEVVKAQAGILESDSPAEAEAKLSAIVPAGPDQNWRANGCCRSSAWSPPPPLATSPSPPGACSWRAWPPTIRRSSSSRTSIGPMRRCSPSSSTSPTEATHGPLFVLGHGSPGAPAQHPDFAAGLPNAHRLELAPLTTDETASLVTSLLGAVVPPDLSGPIIERADGNPLYAEEYVALLRDRDLLVESNGTVTASDRCRPAAPRIRSMPCSRRASTLCRPIARAC